MRRWLAENGVEAERLEAKGFGDTKPIASNKTAKGRAENRRKLGCEKNALHL